MNKFVDHLFIAATVLLTVYSQLIMRWQMSMLSGVPSGLVDKIGFFIGNLWRPWIMTALVATFFSGVSWMIVLSKFKLSYAFPFMALNFVLVMLASAAFFGESINGSKILGNLLIVAGVFALARTQG
jgi:drug/metabolite transporter (DMT)-like permease